MPKSSSEMDEEEDDGSASEVVTLTTDNFDELVTQSTGKDILLEFYAP